MIVTIDGPAASGKSTTARAVAKRLNFLYVDTGAMYRAVALAFLTRDIPPNEEDAGSVLDSLDLDVCYDKHGEMQIFLDQKEVTKDIRAEKVGEMASRVSTLPTVRSKLVAEQRRIARNLHHHEGVVLEGRDTGTKVFPEANVKVFLVADVEERARRRQEQLHERGIDASYEKVLSDLKARDAQDMKRSLSPLTKARDAVELDTTDLSIEQQVRFIVDLVRKRR